MEKIIIIIIKKGRQEKETGKNRRRNEGWKQANRQEGKKCGYEM